MMNGFSLGVKDTGMLLQYTPACGEILVEKVGDYKFN